MPLFGSWEKDKLRADSHVGFCVGLCVCMCVYVCVYVCVYIYMYISVCKAEVGDVCVCVPK